MKQKIHFALVSLALFSLVFTGFSSAPPAFATNGIVNVSHVTVVSPSGAAVISSLLGQSFTPVGVADNLVAVDVLLDKTCTDTWTVSLQKVDPSGTEIVAPFPYVVDPSTTIQHIEFSSVSVVAGATYAISITGLNGCLWLLNFTDTYPDGDAFIPGLFAGDFLFTTYYDDGTAPPPPPPPVDEICDDGIDNDGDGLIDADDPDCPAPPPPPPPVDEICDDGIDNDGDGLIDADDPDCPAPPPPPPLVDEICDDGIDNDGDGLIDADDLDCPAPPPPPDDEKKSCEALGKENPAEAKGKAQGKEKAKENNCS